MLVIRAEQIEAMREQKRRELARWLAGYLRGSCAALVEPLSDAALFERVLSGIRRAETYGLTDSEPAMRFVLTTFQRGEHFDRHPDIRALLTEPSIPPALRLDTVFASIDERRWREARAIRDGA